MLFCYLSVFNYIKVQFPIKLNKTIQIRHFLCIREQVTKIRKLVDE